MRYVVSFAHRKYLEIQKRVLADPDFEIPTGLYRQLSVVVEAKSEPEAVDEALKELGWPDFELELVPIGVMSQRDLADRLRATMPAWFRDAAREESG